LGDGPVLSFSPDEPFILGSPKVRIFNNKWYLWYSSGRKWVKRKNKRPEPVYKIRMAISSDGLNWKKVNKNLIENFLEKDECQASPDVFYYKGIYHMWFSHRYNFDFNSKNKGYRFGYAYSNDLINWTRDDSKAGIIKSNSGWDSESISYGHVFNIDDNIYLLYQGNNIGKTGFGIAKMNKNIF
jgi:predicted GH43/DUF377 family glycosyl hydrolase